MAVAAASSLRKGQSGEFSIRSGVIVTPPSAYQGIGVSDKMLTKADGKTFMTCSVKDSELMTVLGLQYKNASMAPRSDYCPSKWVQYLKAMREEQMKTACQSAFERHDADCSAEWTPTKMKRRDLIGEIPETFKLTIAVPGEEVHSMVVKKAARPQSDICVELTPENLAFLKKVILADPPDFECPIAQVAKRSRGGDDMTQQFPSCPNVQTRETNGREYVWASHGIGVNRKFITRTVPKAATDEVRLALAVSVQSQFNSVTGALLVDEVADASGATDNAADEVADEATDEAAGEANDDDAADEAVGEAADHDAADEAADDDATENGESDELEAGPEE